MVVDDTLASRGAVVALSLFCLASVCPARAQEAPIALIPHRAIYDPVSYTHLDVYKRQVIDDDRVAVADAELTRRFAELRRAGQHMRQFGGMIADGLEVCLLYTSSTAC